MKLPTPVKWRLLCTLSHTSLKEYVLEVEGSGGQHGEPQTGAVSLILSWIAVKLSIKR
jgi:hypothetical protein